MPSKLNSYFAGKLVEKLNFSNTLKKKVIEVLRLIEGSPDSKIKVSEMFREMYPELSASSANKALLRLVEQVNATAKEQGLPFEMKVSAGKGAENRFIWFEGPEPEPNAPYTDALNAIPPDQLYDPQVVIQDDIIAIVTCNEHETAAIRKKFEELGQPQPYPGRAIACDILGRLGGSTIVHCVSGQGLNRAQQTCQALAGALPMLRAVIGVGIAFGVDERKQKIGDVLVAEAVYDYESIRQGLPPERLGLTYPGSGRWLQLLKHVDQTLKSSDERCGRWPQLHFGTLLSGNKLVDDRDFRDNLVKMAANVIGGEMEGLGFYFAVDNKESKIDWLIVKAICDWGANKNNPNKEKDQKLAAENAAIVVYEALRWWNWNQPMTGKAMNLADLKRVEEAGRPILNSYAILDTMNKNDLGGQSNDAEGVNALEALKAWAKQMEPPHCFALLGEYGMGKTIACQRLARDLYGQRQKDASVPLALYFDLRHVTGLKEGVPTLAKTLEDCMENGWLDQSGEGKVTLERLYNIVENQAAVVILDGLDEVLVKLDEADGQAFTRNLLKISEDVASRRKAKKIESAPPLKTLISCRTHFFRTLRDQKNHFTGQDRGQFKAESFAAIVLIPLSDEQVESYLKSAFPELDAEKLMKTVRDVHNLRELSGRPYTLKLLADYLPAIEAERAAGQTIYGVTLYENIVMDWLERDAGKHHIHPKHKPSLAMHLAAYIWREGSGVLEVERLEEWLLEWLESDPALNRRYQNIPPDQLEEDLRTATFLVREDGKSAEKGLFRFAHTSLMEFFLAKYLFAAIAENKPERWQMRQPSRETLDFLGQLLAEAGNWELLQTMNEWGQTRRPPMNELILQYTLLARAKGWPQPSLRGLDLRDAQLPDFRFQGQKENPLDLNEADFSNADLRRSRFLHVNVNGGRFNNAALTQACFDDCSARGAIWRGADCPATTWHKTDLSGGDWKDSTGKHAQFLLCENPPSRKNLSIWPETVLFQGSGQRKWAREKIQDIFVGGTAQCCAWSPDGARLLAGGGHKLQVWDAVTGKKLLELDSVGSVGCCAWSPDGARLLAGGARKLQVWDAVTGKKLLELAAGYVNCCAWSPDGARLMAGVARKLQVWDAVTGKKLLESDAGHVKCCAWSPDGARLLAGGGSKLQVWDAVTGKKLLGLDAGYVECCAWSPDGARLLAGGGSKLQVWDAVTGKKLLGLATGHVECCAWSPDGARLMAGGVGNLAVWDAVTGKKHLECDAGHHIWCCAWSPDGTRLLVGGGSNLAVWDAVTGKKHLECDTGHHIWCCAWSPDGTRLLAGGVVNMTVWDAVTGKKHLELTAGHVEYCAWSPDGARLLSGSSGKLRVWDAVTGKKHLECDAGHHIWCCAWSPDGTRLLSGDSDGTLQVWDAFTGKKHLKFNTGARVISCVWSPDGARLFFRGSGKLQVLDAVTGKKRLELDAGYVNCCAWSPDGARLLSSGGSNLTVWNAVTGEKLREFRISYDSELAWEPPTGKITHASGLYWRDFYWEADLPDGRKEHIPIEAFGVPGGSDGDQGA